MNNVHFLISEALMNAATVAAMGPMATVPKPDDCLLWQYEEEIASFKSELTDISRYVISMKGRNKN